MGISRISMSQYLANLCQTTWTGPHTMLGESVGFPAAWRLARQRHLAAIPPSMQASDDPMAEHPTASPVAGAFHRSARMWTQRRSSSAVWGYSSLSMRFLSIQRSINWWISVSSHVWQNVARFWRALPSRSNSSAIAWYASAGRISSEGQSFHGRLAIMSWSA